MTKKTSLRLTVILICLGAGIIGALIFFNRPVSAPINDVSPNIQQPQGFDKKKFSIDEPTSPWIIVNKSRQIDLGYVPADLVTPKVLINSQKAADENKIRREAAENLERLFADAKKADYDLMLASGYRSSALQKSYYDSYAARDGQAAADRYSARPGTSEHQTGWALDISGSDRKCYLEVCFGDLPEGKWLSENAHKYGFVLRYDKNTEKITGYQYEPWHFRYVGTSLANEIHRSNQTLEEFFGLKTS